MFPSSDNISTETHRDVTDAEWALLRPLLPELQHREDGRGRPWRADREVLNGILYVLKNGTAWARLPDRYPPFQTCHRRYQLWSRMGVMQPILQALDSNEAGRPAGGWGNLAARAAGR